MTNKQKWECPECHQLFLHRNAVHSCNDKSLDEHLQGKSELTKELFYAIVRQFREFGEIALHPAKWRIAFAADIRFAYIHRLGKNYVDLVLQFGQSFDDNYCFYKIANIPGSQTFNHYVRIERQEDLNEEVKGFMRLAYESGLRK